MENDKSSEKSEQKISHLSFLVALLQSIGFEPDTSSDPSDVRDLVVFLGNQDFLKGTTVTITCGYSKKKFTLHLPENEESCNCLAVNGNEGKPLEMYRNEGDVRGLRQLFDALLKHLRDEFIKETKRLKETFELDNVSLTSIIPNFQDISIESETITEFNYSNNTETVSKILNETYTVKVLEVPRQPINQTSLKRHPSAPPALRPEVRRNSLGSKPKKFEHKISPKPKYLKAVHHNTKSPSQASVKSENFKLPVAPKSPSTLSVKSENFQLSTKEKPPTPALVNPEILRSKKPMETKLKTLGTALKNSTISIRRSFGLTSHNKYVPSVKPSSARFSLDTQISSTAGPTKKSPRASRYSVVSPPSTTQRSSSTERYSKIPMPSSGMVRSQSGVLPKLN